MYTYSRPFKGTVHVNLTKFDLKICRNNGPNVKCFVTVQLVVQGVGYSAIMMVFLENVYYIIVVAWTLYYLFNVFVDMPSLPWSDCEKGSK